MKNFSWKKVLPHVMAIGVFLIVAVIYCRPALEGKVVQQFDIVHWKGMSQNAFEYKEKTGHFPLWNKSLFSGMPNYQVTTEAKSFLIDFHSILTLGLPKPIAFFFVACVCFYILTQTLGIQFMIGILASLAFAYASYDPVIIVAGHESKMWAMAYMPAVLSGLLLIYQKRYITGLAVTAVFATQQIGHNHPQISYYFFLSVGIITLGYIIEWVRTKQWKHALIALSLAALGGFISFANSSIALLTTQEYAAYTMRGGKTLEINGTDIKKVHTKGLDPDYAFSYSFGKSEVLTFMAPNIFGSSSGESMSEDQHFIDALIAKGVPEQNATQLASGLPRYWGGIQPSTSGPVYLGAIIVLLALIALVVVKQAVRWYILAAAVFAIFIAWGSYFPFNTFLLNHFPYFDKFRAPSMALVIPQLLFPVLAAMALQQIFFTANGQEELKKSFKSVLYVVGGLVALTGIIYLFNDFSAGIDSQIMQAYGSGDSNGGGKMIVAALQESRKAMFMAGLGRIVLFSILVLGVFYLYIKNLIKPVVAILVFLVINTLDLLIIDNKYMGSDQYVDKDEYASMNFTPSKANITILEDKDPHYRVYNLAPDRFSDAITSYFHRSVGGYHAAKLGIYQDLIEAQLSKSPLNMSVLNMLDTRYFILPAQQQQPEPMVEKNAGALGAAWFVKSIHYVEGPVEEMKALDHFNPKDTVIINTGAKAVIKGLPVPDSTATIQLVSYDNDNIEYASAATSNQFAVFSEVYYPAGWNAYIDGVKTPYVKVNYVLRGMEIPAGKHKIEYKFEPASHKTGQTLTYMGNALLWLSVALAVFATWKRNKKPA